MTDAINASEVLNAQELDAVSGGFMCLPLVAVKVAAAIKGGGGGEPGRRVVRTIRPKCFNRFCSN